MTEVLDHFIDMGLQREHPGHRIVFRDGSLLLRMNIRIALAEEVVNDFAFDLGATAMIELSLSC